ncbi:hypothetical protein VPH35_026413 [Triticum aestivum]
MSSSANVSQVAFVLAAVAFVSLFSSSLGGATYSSLPSGAVLSARLAALCGFATTKKALFVLSNAIFLFLAADCRCFLPGVCSMVDSSMSESDNVVRVSELPPCGSYPGSLCCNSNTKGAPASCSGKQGQAEEVPVSSPPESALETFVVVEKRTCHAVAEEELEKLAIEELNRKFEDFIQSRRIKWLEEEEQVLQWQQVV